MKQRKLSGRKETPSGVVLKRRRFAALKKEATYQKETGHGHKLNVLMQYVLVRIN